MVFLFLFANEFTKHLAEKKYIDYGVYTTWFFRGDSYGAHIFRAIAKIIPIALISIAFYSIYKAYKKENKTLNDAFEELKGIIFKKKF